MKKIICIFLFICCALNCFSQTVFIEKREVKYDESFNPVATITVKNNTDKTVTNIELNITFSSLPANEPFHPSDFNMVNTRYVKKNESVTILPRSSKQVSISAKSPVEGFNYRGCGLSKVRFSDGSTIQ